VEEDEVDLEIGVEAQEGDEDRVSISCHPVQAVLVAITKCLRTGDTSDGDENHADFPDRGGLPRQHSQQQGSANGNGDVASNAAAESQVSAGTAQVGRTQQPLQAGQSQGQGQGQAQRQGQGQGQRGRGGFASRQSGTANGNGTSARQSTRLPIAQQQQGSEKKGSIYKSVTPSGVPAAV
jgi:hypothetical protein